jgi:hypothetical protein
MSINLDLMIMSMYVHVYRRKAMQHPGFNSLRLFGVRRPASLLLHFSFMVHQAHFEKKFGSEIPDYIWYFGVTWCGLLIGSLSQPPPNYLWLTRIHGRR